MHRPILFCLAALAMAGSQAGAGTFIESENCRPVEDSFIVVFDAERLPDRVPEVARQLVDRFGGTRSHLFERTLSGFVLKAPEAVARAMARTPFVEYVERDCWGEITATVQADSWGLDRVDQRDLPLDGLYSFASDGQGVHVYIVDSGIRSTHPELVGKVGAGVAIVGSDLDDPCNGHGTHVAGTVAGSNYGLARGVTLHPVVVIGCGTAGTAADAMAGVEWITVNHIDPAVVNMSVSYGSSNSLNTSVASSVAEGITYVVGAGNLTAYSCAYSPGSVASAITVGGTDVTDTVYSKSNTGDCLDLFAPAVGIAAACPSELDFCVLGPPYCSAVAADISTCTGTSMAAPHVTAVAARLKQHFPTATPAEIAQLVVGLATPGKISGITGSGSPNLLLFCDGDESTGPCGLSVPAPEDEDPLLAVYKLLLLDS